MSEDFTEDDQDQDDPDLTEQDHDNDLIRSLRKRAKDGAKALRENSTLKSENASLKSEKLLRTAGLDQLNERQQRAVLGTVEGDVSEASLKAAAVELGFIQPDEGDAAADAAQRAMANAAAGGQQNRNADFITPAEFGSWDMPRRVDFMERHPEKFAALERNESVRVT